VLNAADRQSLRLEFRDVIYLIIDENSLVGPELLRWVDLRCREIFPPLIESLLAWDDWDPNIASSEGDHVLRLSIHRGNGIVKSILDHPDVDSNVELMETCIAGDLGVVQFLLNIEGIDVNRRDPLLCLTIIISGAGRLSVSQNSSSR